MFIVDILSSSYPKRKRGMESGDESKLRVRMASLIVRSLAALLIVAYDRGFFWIVEQPSSSQMWNYSPTQHCLVYCKAARAHTWLVSFGHEMHKPSVLWGALPTSALLVRTK